MGLLHDAPAAVDDRGGEGQKFVHLFNEVFDDEDRERVRRWDADPTVPTSEIWRRIKRHYPIGRSSVERGLPRLRAQWES